MRTCPSCGGIIGRDCFNPVECAWITQQLQIELSRQGNGQSFHEGYRQGYAEGYQTALNELAAREAGAKEERDHNELPF